MIKGQFNIRIMGVCARDIRPNRQMPIDANIREKEKTAVGGPTTGKAAGLWVGGFGLVALGSRLLFEGSNAVLGRCSAALHFRKHPVEGPDLPDFVL